MKHCFIVAYGRSGSTLLLGVLNSISGWDIRGENGGIAPALFRLRADIQRQRERRGKNIGAPTHAWFGIHEADIGAFDRQAASMMTNVVMRPEADTRVTGFKEIRWGFGTDNGLLMWMAKIYPSAKFIFNYRSPSDTAKSGWWADNDYSLAKINELREGMQVAEKTLGDRAFRVDYDNYCDRPENLKPLFEFFRESFDPKQISEVMKRPHSYIQQRKFGSGPKIRNRRTKKGKTVD